MASKTVNGIKCVTNIRLIQSCIGANVRCSNTANICRYYSSRTVKYSSSKTKYWTIPKVVCAGVLVSCSLGSEWLRNAVSERFSVSHVSAAESSWQQGDNTTISSKRRQLNFIADAVEKAAPAVVYIEIKGRNPLTGSEVTLSNGSGFLIREDGLILTNAHVVANKRVVTVHLFDGTIVDGVIQAVDPISDLATLKINKTGLPVLRFGSSSSLRAGEWVIAVGSPLSLSNTVTAGIVSTTQRTSKELGIHHKDIDYIQTDALITFGHSGGPLINLDGEAVGINTMKVATGISFAIPTDYARTFLQKADKLESRTTSRGWFGATVTDDVTPVKRRYVGISMLTLTPTLIGELQLRHPDFPPHLAGGVLIHKVVVGSPAYSGGLHPGDIVVSINGRAVTSASDVFTAVDSGDDLKVTLQRGRQTVEVVISPEPLAY